MRSTRESLAFLFIPLQAYVTLATRGGAVAGEPAGPRAAPLPYLDPTLPAMKRAQDLVQRLSLEQQVELLLATNQRTGGVNTSDIHIRSYNWWTECNSGIEVEYPQNINIAATFNRSAAFLAGRGTGVGLRKRADAEVQDLSCWSPMMNLMRHPLWGRAHEGYGMSLNYLCASERCLDAVPIP
jgi:beta-glucosidase